jgi:hypothetical protein
MVDRAEFSGLSRRVYDVMISSLKRCVRGFDQLLSSSSPPLIEWSNVESVYERDEEFRRFASSPEDMTRSVLASLAVESFVQVNACPVLWSDSRLWSWTEEGQMAMVLRAYEKNDSLFCALLCTSLLERGLANLFSCLNEGARPPPLFRDMLDHGSMRCLGQGAIGFLRALIGHPLGLNLRNIVWHGFLSVVPPEWLTLLVVTTVSMGPLFARFPQYIRFQPSLLTKHILVKNEKLPNPIYEESDFNLPPDVDVQVCVEIELDDI